MNALFDPDGKLMYYGSKLWDLIWLNILTVTCLIPIFTIGVAFSSMHYVLIKIQRNECGSVTKEFLKAFQGNFKQGIVGTLIMAATAYLLYIDYQLLQTSVPAFFRFLFPVILLTVMCVFSWFFVMQARYHNSVWQTLKNAWLLCIKHIPKTIMMASLSVIPFLLPLIHPYFLMYITLFGFTLSGLIESYLYLPVLVKIEEQI